MPGSERQNNMFDATVGYVQDDNPIKKTSCGRRRNIGNKLSLYIVQYVSVGY